MSCLKINYYYDYLCFFTYFYNCNDMLFILFKLNLFGNNEFDEKILDVFDEISYNFCCICGKFINNEKPIFICYLNNEKEIKKNDFNEYVNNSDLCHFTCKECFDKNYNQSFECKICKFKHEKLGKNKENFEDKIKIKKKKEKADEFKIYQSQNIKNYNNFDDINNNNYFNNQSQNYNFHNFRNHHRNNILFKFFNLFK